MRARPLTREEEMRAFDAKSDSQIRAEAKADRMLAGFIGVAWVCPECNLEVEPEDDDCRCPRCGESCWAEPRTVFDKPRAKP